MLMLDCAEPRSLIPGIIHSNTLQRILRAHSCTNRCSNGRNVREFENLSIGWETTFYGTGRLGDGRAAKPSHDHSRYWRMTERRRLLHEEGAHAAQGEPLYVYQYPCGTG
jgi:hypothetical protein